MRVKEYIMDSMAKGALHMTLIDPASQSPEKSGEIARIAEDVGTDAIMVGGSTGVTQENLDKTILSIKEKVAIPVIYFPSGAHAISPYADAIYFMSILNSRNIRNVIREQVIGAPIVKKLGLEPISMGYIIIEPGMKVGEVGDAELIQRNDSKSAVAYGLAAEYLGMDLVYLEAGSGAPEPVPTEMITAMRAQLSVPLVVGGGIRHHTTASAVRKAGANIVVTGTVVENGDFRKSLESIVKAVKS
ncbi:MAG TPA: geranylgeranylglyceryl/heptaprenylglyceryl phosphate synthase [Methanomassiliicoccales archaeon]|nr:geranylgeranylglyceryl/heptaprenylglyceryl phosphate synthase [Methanomassiliicoccales archaeon]